MRMTEPRRDFQSGPGGRGGGFRKEKTREVEKRKKRKKRKKRRASIDREPQEKRRTQPTAPIAYLSLREKIKCSPALSPLRRWALMARRGGAGRGGDGCGGGGERGIGRGDVDGASSFVVVVVSAAALSVVAVVSLLPLTAAKMTAPSSAARGGSSIAQEREERLLSPLTALEIFEESGAKKRETERKKTGQNRNLWRSGLLSRCSRSLALSRLSILSFRSLEAASRVLLFSSTITRTGTLSPPPRGE